MVAEGIEKNDDLGSITDDHAWKGLDDVFELKLESLSENVDEILYQLNGEE